MEGLLGGSVIGTVSHWTNSRGRMLTILSVQRDTSSVQYHGQLTAAIRRRDQPEQHEDDQHPVPHRSRLPGYMDHINEDGIRSRLDSVSHGAVHPA
jgi:hypothetical protein